HATLAAPAAGAVRINEILAVNNTAHAVDGRYPDLVELRNTGAEAYDLSGHSLSDADGNSYLFPEGSMLEAGELLLLTEVTLGFGFSGSGDSLTLADAGATPLDSVAFGPQVADLSIARLAGNEDSWGLAVPTPDAANGAAVALADPSGLKLNEWAGNIDFRLSGDFVELHNPGAAPVALGGMAVTDEFRSYPQRFAFPALSYLSAGGYLALDSDALGFGIDGRFDDLWLIGANGGVVGRASAISQFSDASTGLSPDGGSAWADFPLPTPGMSNATDPGAHADLLAWLRITEIHFAPTGGGDYEFIELRNCSGTVTLDLSGVRFTKGIDYTFPAGTSLAPGAYAVVCKKRSSYLSRYTDNAAVTALLPGNFSGALDNSGEQLALTLPAPWQLNILRFGYEPGWYPLTTGGHSLVTRDAAATAARDWGESTIWVASGVPHGTPGGDDPPVITSPLAANGVRGDAFSYLIAATKSPTSYGADGLPAGLALDPATGLITGTPGETGEFTVALSASNGSATGRAVLTLNIAGHGPLDHFTWDFMPLTAWAGVPFAVRVTARDAGERVVATFAGSAAMTASREGNAASPVLITEITDEAEDQFELQNVTGSPVSTAGWFVVLGDSTTNVSFRNPLTYYLPASMAAGAMLRVSEANTAGRIFFGAPINWASSGTSRGWVMLFDAGSNLRDFVAFGWAAADLANLSLTVNGKTIAPVAAGEWSGGGLTVGPRGNSSQTTDSWQRVGGSDGNAPSDWQWVRLGASFGIANSALNLPFVSAVPLTVTPASASFANGGFTGYLSIAEPGSAACLTATNGAATSTSPLMDVLDATDTDGDGMPDSYEAAHGLLPGTPDGHLDMDGDGQSNFAEFVAGTAPNAAVSVLALSGHNLDSGHESLTIRWQAVAGVYYRVMAGDDLSGWSPVAFRLATADGSEEVTVPTGGSPRYFLRVEVVPWPSP
nr:lamin tail domain-containing protein [Akkermansiaceae bacterium]